LQISYRYVFKNIVPIKESEANIEKKMKKNDFFYFFIFFKKFAFNKKYM
jgi:hypothetical protein